MRRFFSACSLALTVYLPASAPLAEHHPKEEPVTEYAAKSALVFKLPGFVKWPESGRAAQETFVLAVAGAKQPFTHFKALSGKPILVKGESNTRTLIVKPFTKESAPDEIDMLFVCDSAEQRIPEILAQVKGHDVLTVGESRGFLDHGGMIEFFVNRKKRVRFTIRNENALKRGLRMDTQLLQISEPRP